MLFHVKDLHEVGVVEELEVGMGARTGQGGEPLLLNRLAIAYLDA